VSSSGIRHSDVLRQLSSSEPRRAHPYAQSVHASLRLVERRGKSFRYYRVQMFIYLNPLHPAEQRYRHPAGPRYDRVEHRVHNICRSLYAEISPRGLKLLFALIKLPRFLDTFPLYHKKLSAYPCGELWQEKEARHRCSSRSVCRNQ
jgi:hypothetical protein